MSLWFDRHVLAPHELALIRKSRNAVHRAHWRQTGMIVVRLCTRWPTQHGTHRMRSGSLLLLMHHLLLMHLHLQLLLLLMMNPHQFFLVSVSLYLVRIQV